MLKDKIFIWTGNTVIDALLYTVETHPSEIPTLKLDNNLKTILLTSHRRENFGDPLKNICKAIKIIVQNNSDVQVVYPVHLNPNVRNIVFQELNGIERVKLIEPLDYAPFASLMKQSYLILTDSGGIQEEAPSLGKPVFVLRNETERPEAVDCGTVKLVGTNTEKIVSSVQELIDSKVKYREIESSINPYGDGQASKNLKSN